MPLSALRETCHFRQKVIQMAYDIALQQNTGYSVALNLAVPSWLDRRN